MNCLSRGIFNEGGSLSEGGASWAMSRRC